MLSRLCRLIQISQQHPFSFLSESCGGIDRAGRFASATLENTKGNNFHCLFFTKVSTDANGICHIGGLSILTASLNLPCFAHLETVARSTCKTFAASAAVRYSFIYQK